MRHLENSDNKRCGCTERKCYLAHFTQAKILGHGPAVRPAVCTDENIVLIVTQRKVYMGKRQSVSRGPSTEIHNFSPSMRPETVLCGLKLLCKIKLNITVLKCMQYGEPRRKRVLNFFWGRVFSSVGETLI